MEDLVATGEKPVYGDSSCGRAQFDEGVRLIVPTKCTVTQDGPRFDYREAAGSLKPFVVRGIAQTQSLATSFPGVRASKIRTPAAAHTLG
jgi:hypothetical protein